MQLFVILALIATGLATPIQQEGRQFRDEIRHSDGSVVGKYGFQDPSGSLRIVKYNVGRDGIIPNNDGLPIAPQPIVWNPEEPIIVEPAPMTYGAVKGGSIITERDQQRHISNEEELEVREDVSDEESKPVNEPKVELDSKDESDVKVEEQKPRDQTFGLLGVKGAKKPVQVLSLDNEQIFPQVVSGQRRLIEPQFQPIPQQYAIKGRSLRPINYGSVRQQTSYQSVQHGLPITIEEHRVSPQGVKRPVVQYQINPVQNRQQFVPREWVRKPSYQVVQQSGTKQPQRPLQYYIQPVIPQQINPVQAQQYEQYFNVPQVVNQRPVELSVSQHDLAHVGVHDVDHRPLHVVHELTKHEVQVPKQQVKGQALTHVVEEHKVVQESGRHVPVVSGQRVIGYQLVNNPQQQPQQQQYFVQQQPQQQQQYLVQQQPQQQQQQQQLQQQLQQQQQQYFVQQQQHSVQQQQPLGQQNVQYGPYNQQQIPISDIQQYYQLVQQYPIQSYGVGPQEQPLIGYPYVGQQQPLQYSGVDVAQVDQNPDVRQTQGVKGYGVEQGQFEHGQPVQGHQQIQAQDVRINPLHVQQRHQSSGTKSAVHV